MNNKPIINGIDVNECCFYNNGKCNNPNGMACNCANNAVCYFKELKRLQKENEKLKANKVRCAFKCLDNTFCDEAKIKIDKLELDKDCLNASLETARKYRGIAETDRDKYEQALEEIRQITEQDRNCMNSELACCRLCDKLDLIKEKINKVLNDRD